ncbi:MAG: lysoplasmalogenase [Ginsengibacter sp.]
MTHVKKSFTAFFLISAVYLVCTLLYIEEATFFIKPLLLIPLLIAVFYSQTFYHKTRLFFALTFSWLGDILLLFVFKDNLFFIAGLLSFLIAHIFYVLLFLNELKTVNGKFKIRQPGLTLIVLYLIAFYALLGPYLGDMQIPVIAYAFVIGLMLYVAYLLYPFWTKPSSIFLLAGAASFVLSDSLLAINKFFAPFPNAGFFIMITYLFAQGALVWACMGRRRLV